MKELLIDRKSWSYKMATKHGDLYTDLTDSWGDPVSSCYYWGQVMSGLFRVGMLFVLFIIAAAITQDFVLWAWFGFMVGFLEPGGGAIIVIAVIIFGCGALILGGGIKLCKLGANATEKVEAVRSFKDSVIHKLCVPIRLKE